MTRTVKRCTPRKNCELMRRAIEGSAKRCGFGYVFTLRGGSGIAFRTMGGENFVCNVCPFCMRPIFVSPKPRAKVTP